MSKNDSLVTRLESIISEALRLNAELEGNTHRKVIQQDGAKHGKVDFSKAPGNSNVLILIMDLHALSREGELALRYNLGQPLRDRGGSDGNTAKALESILKMAATADESAVREQLRQINGWCKAALRVLGRIEKPKSLPRQPGQPEPKCPWCKLTTLRTFPLQGSISCINMACRDDEGRRPRGVVEYFRADFVIRWQDGIIGTPAAEYEAAA